MKERNRDYLPFEQWIWKNYDGTEVVSIDKFVERNKDNFFMIGTDSQNYSKRSTCVFTSVLISYRMGKGGTVIICKDKVPFIESLRQRLLLEAMRSLEVAWHIDPLVSSKNIIEIHLDVNPSLKYNSGRYKDELIGLVSSQGFSALCKPDSFAASSCADRKC